MAGNRTRVAATAEIREGVLFSTRVNDTRLLLTRVAGKPYAVVDRCTHLGMPMRKGKLDGSVITCPFHGSKFDLCSGKNLDWVNGVMGIPTPQWTHKLIALGKAPAPLKTLAVAEQDGEVFVTL